MRDLDKAVTITAGEQQSDRTSSEKAQANLQAGQQSSNIKRFESSETSDSVEISDVSAGDCGPLEQNKEHLMSRFCKDPDRESCLNHSRSADMVIREMLEMPLGSMTSGPSSNKEGSKNKKQGQLPSTMRSAFKPYQHSGNDQLDQHRSGRQLQASGSRQHGSLLH